MPVKRSNNAELKAKNYRLVDTAKRTMEDLLSMNRQNVYNAIQATGFPVTVYVRKTTGRRCTCSFHRQELLDARGNLGAGTIDSLVSGTESGIGVYGDDDRSYTAKWNEDTTEITDSFFPNSEADISSTSVNLIGGRGDPMFTELDEGSELLDLDPTGDDVEDNRLFIGNNTSCGICFGTSFVGGFDLLFGTRVIADTTLKHSIVVGELDAVSSPNKFLVHEGGHVVFDLAFPAAVPFALYPRVFDNKRELELGAYKLEISSDSGNTWVIVTPQTARALCIGLPCRIKISPVGPHSLSFTHIEFMFSSRRIEDPPKADFPEVSKQVVLTMADALASSNIIVPGDLIVNRFSIVIDHLPGLSRHWMVNTITPRRDQFGNIYDTQLDSRVCDLNELCQLLRPLTLNSEPLV